MGKIDKFVNYIKDRFRKRNIQTSNKGKINRLLKNEFGSQSIRSGDVQEVINHLKRDGFLEHDSDAYGSYVYDVNLNEGSKNIRNVVREEIRRVLNEQAPDDLPRKAKSLIRDAQLKLDQAKGELLGTQFERSDLYNDLNNADRILKGIIDQLR